MGLCAINKLSLIQVPGQIPKIVAPVLPDKRSFLGEPKNKTPEFAGTLLDPRRIPREGGFREFFRAMFGPERTESELRSEIKRLELEARHWAAADPSYASELNSRASAILKAIYDSYPPNNNLD